MSKKTVLIRVNQEDYKTLKNQFEPLFRKTNPEFMGSTSVAFLFHRILFHALDKPHELEFYYKK